MKHTGQSNAASHSLLLADGADCFVGRRAELERLRQLLSEQSRLVTILGPPGVGKTRLALEAGRQVISEIISGPTSDSKTGRYGEVWFVDLTAATTSADVLAALGELLHIPIESAESAVVKIGAALAERGSVLLILDNLEQLVPFVASLLTDWLARAPASRWVATSQRRLCVPGEQLLELAPLALPSPDLTMAQLSEVESAQLFLQRARSVGAELLEQAEDADLLIQVLRLLDGLPLAIEMAAARMNLLDLRELRHRLDQRFLLLRDRYEGRSERHRSLRVAIEWSWELLNPWERAALAQCSVFEGGFDIEAAEAVVFVEGDQAPAVLEIIQSLRDKSLIQRSLVDQTSRLMLCLSIREFAAEALEHMGDEAAVARRRHAMYFAHVCRQSRERLETAEAMAGIRRLQRERDNLFAVISRQSEGLSENDIVTAVAGLEVALGLEAASSLDGPSERAESALAKALESAESLGVDTDRLSRCRVAHARSLRRLGRMDEALDEFQKVQALLKPSTENALVAALEIERVFFCARRGELKESVSHCRRAVDLLSTCDQPRDEALVRSGWSSILAILGRVDEAAEQAERALSLLRGGSPIDEAEVLVNLALSRRQLGETAQAQEYGLRALDIAERCQHARSEGWALFVLTSAAADECRFDEAERFVRRAVDAFLRIGELQMGAYCLVYQAEVACWQGRPQEADVHLRRAQALDQQTDARFREAVFAVLARRAWDEQRYEAASEALQSALESGGADSPNWALYYLSQLGALAHLVGDEHLARARFDEAEQKQSQASPLYMVAAQVYRSILLTREGYDAAETQVRLDRLAAALSEVMALGRRAGYPGSTLPSCERSSLVRLAAQRVLLAVPSRHRAHLEARARDPDHQALVVEAEGRWFRPPGEKEVDLSRRPLIARLVSVLVSRRLDDGGGSIPADELVDRLWPGETLLHESALDRVYFNVRQLRKLGLGELILSDGDGYRLDDQTAVLRVPEIGLA